MNKVNGLNLEHLRSTDRGGIKDNSMAVGITKGMDELGKAHTYGSVAAADLRNSFSEQEDMNKNSEI